MSRQKGILVNDRVNNLSANTLLCKNSENAIHTKFPILKSKARVLASTGNKELPKANINKGALERQRENASKLTAGRSVLDKANKENEIIRNKSTKPQLQTINQVFKQPKLNKSKGVLNNRLEKSSSLIPTLMKEELKKQEKQSKINLEKCSIASEIIQSVVVDKIEIENAAVVKENINSDQKIQLPTLNNLIDKEEESESSEFLLGVYADDIHKFLKELELKQPIRKNYLNSLHIMTPSMRCLLVDWLFEVQLSFKLLNETIHLTVALLDRFMQDHPHIGKNELQLVGVTCIFLASKYEEMYPPDLIDLVEISAKTYSKMEIIKMEQVIFSSLNFQMGHPLPSHFLRRYGRAGNVDITTYSLAKYFIDLCLLSYCLCHISPSLMAASSLFLSLFLLSKEESEAEFCSTSKNFCEYKWYEIRPIIRNLAFVVWKVPDSKYQTVRNKYLDPKRMHCVSALEELKSEKLYKLAHES